MNIWSMLFEFGNVRCCTVPIFTVRRSRHILDWEFCETLRTRRTQLWDAGQKSDYVRVTEAYTDQYYGNAAAAEGAAAWCQRIAVSAWLTHGWSQINRPGETANRLIIRSTRPADALISTSFRAAQGRLYDDLLQRCKVCQLAKHFWNK